MIRRFWHALVIGHSWRVISTAWNEERSALGYGESESRKQGIWGFTEVYQSCPCGAQRRYRVLGDHRGVSNAAELDRLERMAK